MRLSVRQLRQIIREQVEIAASSTAKRRRSLESSRLKHLLEKDDTKDTEFLKRTSDIVSIKEEQQIYEEWKSKHAQEISNLFAPIEKYLESGADFQKNVVEKRVDRKKKNIRDKKQREPLSKEEEEYLKSGDATSDMWKSGEGKLARRTIYNTENDFDWLKPEFEAPPESILPGTGDSYWGAAIKDMYLIGIMEAFDEKSNVITIDSNTVLDRAFDEDEKMRSLTGDFVNSVKNIALRTGLVRAILGRDTEKAESSSATDLSSGNLITDKESVSEEWSRLGGKSSMTTKNFVRFVLDPKSGLRPIAVRSDEDSKEIIERLSKNKVMSTHIKVIIEEYIEELKEKNKNPKISLQQKSMNEYRILSLEKILKRKDISEMMSQINPDDRPAEYRQVLAYALTKTTPDQVEAAFNEIFERYAARQSASSGSGEASSLIKAILDNSGIPDLKSESHHSHQSDQIFSERWQRLAGILKG